MKILRVTLLRSLSSFTALNLKEGDKFDSAQDLADHIVSKSGNQLEAATISGGSQVEVTANEGTLTVAVITLGE
jgi:hypothetical protein